MWFKILDFLIVFLLCALFGTAFTVSDELVDGVWTAKTFYFYGVCVITFGLVAINLLARKDLLKISFNVLDISLIAFYLYNLIRLFFTKEVPLYNARIIQFTFLLILYFIIKKYFKHLSFDKISPAFFIIVAFLVAGLYQACIGLFQAHNLFGYYSGNFLAFGTFGNPAPYTGFIISVLPFSLGIYLFLDSKNISSIILKYLGLLTFAATIFVLPLTKTRGGWLAAIGGIGVVLFHKYEISTRIKEFLNKTYKKIIVLTLVLSLTGLLSIGLYQIRPASAFGRLLIWKVSTTIITEYPLFGVGYDRFGQVYNSYQGTYFAEKDREEFEKYVAGNVKQAHNEYIETTAELGIIGFVLFIGVFSTVIFGSIEYFRNSPQEVNLQNIRIASLSSIAALMISGFFSYPFQILPTQIIFFILLSIITSTGNYIGFQFATIRKSILRIVSFILLLVLAIFSLKEIEGYNNYNKWNSAVVLSHYQLYNKAIKIYEKLYPELNYSGNFLVNYGGVLALNKQYEKAVEVLNKAKNINSDPNLYISIGNSYKGVGEYEEAENAYKIAANIIPHKFYPKYLLAKLYNENGEFKKAKVMAQNILQMDEKISSAATYQIKKEMKELSKINCLIRQIN